MNEVSALFHNPIVWGSLGLSAGSLLAYIKDIPGAIGAFFRRTFTCSFQVSNMEDSNGYMLLRNWLSSLDYSKKTRNLTAIWEEDESKWRIAPAPGNHLIWIMGRPVWLIRERKDVKADMSGSKARYEESIKIRILGRNKAVIDKTLETIAHFNKKSKYPEGMFKIYMERYNGWSNFGFRQGRSLDSVILPEGQKDELLTDLEWFFSNQKWYAEAGIPYRRGYLLKGTPGTGKSSLVNAIATHYHLPVYLLSLGEGGVSDTGLIELFAAIPKESIILMEDIDASFSDRKNKNKDVANRLTFAGLLNAIDGVASPEGSILFMTTNHPEKLDGALIRPGRIDKVLEFGPATHEQLKSFYTRINGEEKAAVFADKYDGKTIAEAQIYLMEEQCLKV